MEIEIIAALFQWFSEQQVNCHCFCKMDIGKRGCWRVYQATMGNWYQIGKWFWTHIKCLRLQIEIIASIFDWFSKQQVNLSLFLSDWFCRKLGLTDLPGHDRKVTSDKKIIFNWCQRYRGGNRNYFSNFSVIFETANKFVIIFVGLMLEKVGVDGFSGSRREIDIKHEFDFELLRKTLGSTCSIAVFSVISKQQAKFSLFL